MDIYNLMQTCSRDLAMSPSHFMEAEGLGMRLDVINIRHLHHANGSKLDGVLPPE